MNTFTIKQRPVNRVCPTCGLNLTPDAAVCPQCGASVPPGAQTAAESTPPPAQQPVQPAQQPVQPVQQPASTQSAQEARPVFCAACGTKNDAGARFCKACGTKLIHPEGRA